MPPSDPRKIARLVDVQRAIATLKNVDVQALDPSVRMALKAAASEALGPPARGVPRPSTKPRRAATAPQPRATCALCRTRYPVLDATAPRLCPSCAQTNQERSIAIASVPLEGAVCVVTGGRIRLGRATVLALLRRGAVVHATTRFPHSAAERFAKEPDAAAFTDRLHLHRLDLARVDDVAAFGRAILDKHQRVDVLVHNAAQTVKRPPRFYARELERELAPPMLGAAFLAPSPTALARAAATTTTTTLAVHDEGDSAIDLARVNDEGEPLDSRAMNSWLALIDDVDAQELSEVMTINAVAPFVLTRALLPALTMRAATPSVVVSVTSREGQFYAASTKLPRHPHTNMAKAALNMLVRTCGPALVDQGIVWSAVDPGWLSEQRPQGPVAPTRAPPLTLDDGVARVLAPVSSVRAGETFAAGVLWKDFRVAPW